MIMKDMVRVVHCERMKSSKNTM